jgi:hypothetical protein
MLLFLIVWLQALWINGGCGFAVEGSSIDMGIGTDREAVERAPNHKAIVGREDEGGAAILDGVGAGQKRG